MNGSDIRTKDDGRDYRAPSTAALAAEPHLAGRARGRQRLKPLCPAGRQRHPAPCMILIDAGDLESVRPQPFNIYRITSASRASHRHTSLDKPHHNHQIITE